MAEALILKSGGGITSDEVTASRAQVLEGYTAVTNDSGDEAAQGTMPNRQAVSVTLKAGDVYAVPAGYHNGNGRVTANNLTVQTPGDATAANITTGRKAWVNGVQIVGNGADNTTFYNNGITYADSRINNSSASYTSGYANGVATADSRINPDSASYKNGYSKGVESVKPKYIDTVQMTLELEPSHKHYLQITSEMANYRILILNICIYGIDRIEIDGPGNVIDKQTYKFGDTIYLSSVILQGVTNSTVLNVFHDGNGTAIIYGL